MVADVSGKGVSSALLASLLQGALLIAADEPEGLGRRMERINRFLLDRTGGEKYATIFYCLLHADGRLSYVNAAHCPPLVVRAGGELRALEATGMPVGLMDGADFTVAEERMEPGDKVSSTAMASPRRRTRPANSSAGSVCAKRWSAQAAADCAALHDAIQEAVAAFTEGAPQSDDITVLVLEFAG